MSRYLFGKHVTIMLLYMWRLSCLSVEDAADVVEGLEDDPGGAGRRRVKPYRYPTLLSTKGGEGAASQCHSIIAASATYMNVLRR